MDLRLHRLDGKDVQEEWVSTSQPDLFLDHKQHVNVRLCDSCRKNPLNRGAKRFCTKKCENAFKSKTIKVKFLEWQQEAVDLHIQQGFGFKMIARCLGKPQTHVRAALIDSMEWNPKYSKASDIFRRRREAEKRKAALPPKIVKTPKPPLTAEEMAEKKRRYNAKAVEKYYQNHEHNKRISRERNAAWHAACMAGDKSKLLPSRLRARLYKFIKFGSSRTMESLIGCNWEAFKTWIESQWLPGMSWDNWGVGQGKWHIDHIVPCAWFDLKSDDHRGRCFHHSNMRPMWGNKNISKSDTLTDEAKALIQYWSIPPVGILLNHPSNRR